MKNLKMFGEYVMRIIHPTTKMKEFGNARVN